MCCFLVLSFPQPIEPSGVRPVADVDGVQVGEILGVEENQKLEEAWEMYDKAEEIYRGLKDYEKGKPGLEGRFLFCDKPDYDRIDKIWLLSKDSYAEYMPGRVLVHLSDILWKHFLNVMSEWSKKHPGVVRPTFDSVYQIAPIKMDIHALETMELDETSIPGSAEIIETLL